MENLRTHIETDHRNHITLQQYLELGDEYGFKTEEDKLSLVRYLHDLGVILHFQITVSLTKQ
ncbi:MAG: hypothetical protein HC796_01960 [Synechococcaceae cyanobacterium RL_1_2]|nr:hypothetical protein [Synechococcaceae cyanobacterium RL_1_2]